MDIESVPITSIVLDPSNARRHASKNLEALKGSLAKFGQQKPIVVGHNGVVIAGNGTLEAARALGWSAIKIVRTSLEGTEATAFAIADNRSGELAEWDAGVLSDTLRALQAMDFDLGAIGFDESDLAKLLATEVTEGLTDPDELPEQVETRCQPGDLWVLGQHRLLCGDSTEALAVERLMSGDLADLIWTDPPYNVALGMNESPEQAAKRNRRTDGLTVMNDKMADGDFRQFLVDVFTGMALSLREGGGFYIAHADSEGLNFRAAVRESGLTLKQCLIWVKSALVMGRQDYQWKHEPILYGWKEGAAHSWFSDRKQTTVLEFNKPSRNAEHPTMKPTELVAYCIGNSTKHGDLVLDLFGGSGTTMIASEQLARKSYLMELDPKYCDVILTRWEKFTGKEAVRESQD